MKNKGKEEKSLTHVELEASDWNEEKEKWNGEKLSHKNNSKAEDCIWKSSSATFSKANTIRHHECSDAYAAMPPKIGNLSISRKSRMLSSERRKEAHRTQIKIQGKALENVRVHVEYRLSQEQRQCFLEHEQV